jgi:gliding motility-associated-like protein
MTTSTTNGSGITDENGLDPRVVGIEVNGQTGFRFQDLTVEVVSLAGGSPIIGYRGVTTKGIQINNSSDYNIVRTNVVVGGASNGSDSWCAAPATNGGSSFGIDITGNGANANIITSSVLAGAAGAGGAGCGGFPAGGAGTAQNVRVAGTPLATNQSSFNLAAQPTIRMDDIACTNTPIDFRTAASNNWTFGVGSTPGSASGATVTTMYSNLGRKDIGYSGNDYIGFGNIILDDQIIPEFTTNIPIIQGQYRICVGESVGVQATNGGVGYTYIWSVDGVEVYRGVGEDYESFVTTLTTPGIFEFQLNYETSCCGLSLPTSILVYVEDTPDAVVPGDQQICFGEFDGVELTVTGGVPGGSISWAPSTGLTSNDSYTVIALPTSTTTYNITLSDSTGLCVDYASITVEVVDIELVTSVVDATCGPTGEVSVNVTGGSGNYSYLWTPGGFTTATVPNLQSGTYNVLVTDNTNGCQDSAFAVINAAPGALVGFISNSTDVTCNGLTDGSITVTVVGGLAPYTYEWSTGAIETSGATSNTLSGLSGGDYEVTVTDSDGCTYVSDGNVFEPSVVLFDVDTLFDPTCVGIDDGYIRVTTDGGIAPYTYTWNGFPGVTDNFLGGLPSGTYTIVATDFNGCQDSLEVTIQALNVYTGIFDTILCLGESFIFNGTLYDASNTNGVEVLTIFNGCDSTVTVNVTVLDLPIASISADQTVCEGEDADVIFIGTPGAIVTYSIDGGAPLTFTFDGSGVESINTGALLNATSYTLTSVELPGTPNCIQPINENSLVNVVTLPDATISGTADVCFNSAATITFNGTPNAIVTYTVNGGANQTVTLDGSGNATVNTGALTADAIYELVSVELSGAQNCLQSITGNALVTVLDLPTATIDGAVTICSGDNADIAFTGTPDAIVTYTINGGADQTVTLDGSGNATINTGALTANADFELLSIELPGTPNCLQPITGNALVTVLDIPTADIVGGFTCEGESFEVLISGTPNSIVTYNIDGGANQTITLDAQGESLINTGALFGDVTYNLVSVELAGTPSCANLLSESATVSIVDLPTAVISGDTSLCPGGETEVLITGTPGSEVVYSLNGVELSVVLDSNGEAVISTGPLSEDLTYELISVTLSGGACSQTLSGTVEVNVLPLPEPILTAVPDTIFNEESSVLEVTGGVEFEWSPVESDSSVVIVSPEVTTEYTVLVRDENGCEAEVSVIVVVLNRQVVLLLPDAFTPNGDGNNDVFEVFNKQDFSDILMRVYNRWGETVHEGRGQDHGWDGTYKGKEQPQDVYVYYIEATSRTDGEVFKVKGPFTLIR